MDKMLINNNNFKFFFQEYFEPVFQFARKYTGNDAIARDLTQDAFIKLYERRKDFDVMEKAKSFLSNTDMPLRMIVEKLGYSNESSFIRKFKDATGMTPGEYRRQSRGPLL